MYKKKDGQKKFWEGLMANRDDQIGIYLLQSWWFEGRRIKYDTSSKQKTKGEAVIAVDVACLVWCLRSHCTRVGGLEKEKQEQYSA